MDRIPYDDVNNLFKANIEPESSKLMFYILKFTFVERPIKMVESTADFVF